MADTLDVLTLAEAKTALKIDETSNDTRLAKAITAVSRRLDEACGPIVKRTLTTEEHHDLDGQTLIWLRWRPVLSITTVIEYDTAGTSTTLTAESVSSKPSSSYRADRREGLGATLSGRIHRRASGAPATFAETVAVTYVGGRYEDTASVDSAFKESASVALINWWTQVLAAEPIGSQGEFDSPGYRFPRYALPDAALDMLPSTERRTRIGVA